MIGQPKDSAEDAFSSAGRFASRCLEVLVLRRLVKPPTYRESVVCGPTGSVEVRDEGVDVQKNWK